MKAPKPNESITDNVRESGILPQGKIPDSLINCAKSFAFQLIDTVLANKFALKS